MLNIYTASEEELAGLEKIGQSSIQRIVELPAKALTGEHEPLTVMYLAKIRLLADYLFVCLVLNDASTLVGH